MCKNQNCECASVTASITGNEVITTIHQTARVMLESIAYLNNSIRELEQKSSMSPEPVMNSIVHRLRTTADNLSEQWDELDLTLSAHDLH